MAQAQRQASQGNEIEISLKGDCYLNFINSLKSEVTKECYRNALLRFMKQSKIKDTESLAQLSPAEIEFFLKRYLEHQKQIGGSYSSMNMITNAVNHFCVMNDIVINSRKIAKFKTPKGNGKGKGQEKDEAYSHEEIQKLLNVSSLRMKVCILVYASTGIRKSALADIQMRHLEKLHKANLYKFAVYSGDREQYITYCTPECAKTIDEYLDYRTRLGEILTPESYLIREDFDITDIVQIRSKSRQVSVRTIGSNLYSLLIRAGLRERAQDPFARKRVPIFHGFRKFFTTQLENSGVNPLHGLMLEGHSTGIRDHYARPSQDKLLQEYIKAVDNLTINEENRLRMKVASLQVEEDKQLKIEQLQRQIKQMQEQTDKKLDSLSFDMDKWKEQFWKDLDNAEVIRKRRQRERDKAK